MTIPRPFARPTAKPDMPQTPAEVGCVPACGKYRPWVYACLECLDRARGKPAD